MISTEPDKKSVRQRAWVAIRFVLFGIGGFWAMLGFTVAFAIRILGEDQGMISPWLSLPLAFIGALIMLYGVGEWRRWAYLWVFLSIPISFCLLQAIPGASNSDLPVFVAAAAAFVIYGVVEAYYARYRNQALDQDDDS